MNAVVYHGVNDLRYSELEKPEIQPGSVLVRVIACSLCGSDLRTIRHGHAAIKEPRVLGHETVGVVEEVGSGVSRYKIGDKVAITPGVGCGTCSYCLSGWQNMCYSRKTISQHYDGGFAEYVLVPASAVSAGNINMIPKGVGFIEASLAEPLACVLNAQEDMKIGVGDTVVVIGAGPIGIMHGMVARATGAGKVIMLNRTPGRLEIAKQFGFDAYIDLSNEDGDDVVMTLTDGKGANDVIVAAGSKDAIISGIKMTGKMGKVCMFAGLPKDSPEVLLDLNYMHYRQISLHGAFSSAPRHNAMALEMIRSGQVKTKKIVTHLVSLEKMVEGVEAAENRTGLRVVVSPCLNELRDEIGEYTWLKTIR
jgi:L-iditol 2-dehydrogenase